MVNYDVILEWSKLLPLTTDEINKLNLSGIEGVFRISKKESDGKFYVVFIGSTTDLQKELLGLSSTENSILPKQDGNFSFRYAPVNKGEEIRRAIEKQMYKQYVPKYNVKEPISLLEIRVNLN